MQLGFSVGGTTSPTTHMTDDWLVSIFVAVKNRGKLMPSLMSA